MLRFNKPVGHHILRSCIYKQTASISSFNSRLFEAKSVIKERKTFVISRRHQTTAQEVIVYHYIYYYVSFYYSYSFEFYFNYT